MPLAGIHRAGAPVAFLAYHIAFLCRTLNKTIALRGHKPGFGPAAEILSLRRQRKNSKKGDPGVAAPKGVPICAIQKMGRPETRLRLKQRSFLIHFLYRTNGGYTWELQKSKATPTSKATLHGI
ncbi:hypothetical protein [Undibacterium sp. KW1]|uniref:hypothetical protein n=1 Tax=Undibacterium sp. KW1 TaxID=2058624 RepID=UPI00138A147C|nr:hypothetical protein [Undibacterium sp. KW1]